jgi:hypothetical protein
MLIFMTAVLAVTIGLGLVAFKRRPKARKVYWQACRQCGEAIGQALEASSDTEAMLEQSALTVRCEACRASAVAVVASLGAGEQLPR